jgi:hypothetical protein
MNLEPGFPTLRLVSLGKKLLGRHHHHWLDSPVWALAFFKSFLHSSLFNAKFFQFFSPNFRLK